MRSSAWRDRGLCVRCQGQALPSQWQFLILSVRRGLAELLDTTVARLSTERYCERCTPLARTRCRTVGCQRLAIVGEDSCRQCLDDGRR